MPHFTQNWSTAISNSIDRCYPLAPTGPLTVVEVGSFEGRGSLLLHERLCKNPGSKLICIDPWQDSYVANFTPFQNLDPLFKGQWERFQANTAHLSNLTALRGTSTEKIPELADTSVDFAYIDGDHSPGQVYLDGKYMFDKLRVGGYMVFDDYEWEHAGQRCRDGVDRFVMEFKDHLKVLFKNWQLGIQKISTTR